MTLIYSALGLAFLWLAAISFFLFRIIRHYKNLTERTGEKSIDKVLDSLLDQDSKHDKTIELIKEAIMTLETQAKKHLQRVGFVKFNPFERSGGEQSFVIALLDSTNSGIVKTFMYTREGVRIYVKQVKDGKPTEYELSDEEKEAIRLAQ
jgi:rubrerythrin